MASSLNRRFRREQERQQKKLIEKIHRETVQRFKGMSDEEIKQEIEKFNYLNQEQDPLELVQPHDVTDEEIKELYGVKE